MIVSGNPKFIIEQLDPLISGYAEGEYVSHGRARGKASGPMLPAIKIATHHELSVNTKSLSDYPWPKKIVGFVEQSYQDLNEKLQVRCYHARSSFDLLVGRNTSGKRRESEKRKREEEKIAQRGRGHRFKKHT